MSTFALVCSLVSVVLSGWSIVVSHRALRRSRRAVVVAERARRVAEMPLRQTQGSRAGQRYRNDGPYRVYEDGTRILIGEVRRGS